MKIFTYGWLPYLVKIIFKVQYFYVLFNQIIIFLVLLNHTKKSFPNCKTFMKLNKDVKTSFWLVLILKLDFKIFWIYLKLNGACFTIFQAKINRKKTKKINRRRNPMFLLFNIAFVILFNLFGSSLISYYKLYSY